MKKHVVLGEAFGSLQATAVEVDAAEVIEAKTKANESRTKSNLAYGAVIGGTTSLTVSALMGIYDGSFDELQSVWNVFGPIVGGVFGHYFGGNDRNHGSKKDNG